MKRASAFLLLLLVSAILASAQAPIVPPGSIVNGATFSGTEPIGPGSLISIFGTALASTPASADTIPISASLGGATVTFTGDAGTFQAPILFASPGDPANNVPSQINAQVPWELIPNGTTSATVNVVVANDGLMSQSTPVTVNSVSPGIFALNSRGFAVNYPDNQVAWPVGVDPNLTTHPAKAGGILVIYCTGLGPVDSPVADGENSEDKLRNTLTVPIVTIGGVSAPVSFSGLSPQFVGVYQLNVTVPSGVTPGDNVPLQLQMDGITTPATASTIAISQ